MLSTLTSKKFALLVLGALTLVLVPATISKLPLFVDAGRLLLGLLAISLSLCTVKRWRLLAGSVILIHAGVLIILTGTLVSRAGFVATVNIYEGDSSATAFRWDRQEDMPLDFTLTVTKINHAYYPVPVRVGVLVDGRPTKLYEVKTGESFEHEGFQIEILDLNLKAPPPAAASPQPSPTLHFAITGADGLRTEQAATKEPPTKQSGLTLQLVAFQTPIVKRSWVDLSLRQGAAPPVTGQSEVNHPLQWHGLRFYHTATSTDTYGQAYAGIQIVNDQGIPVVYLGFIVVFLGNASFLFRKIHKKNRRPHPSPHGDVDR